MAAIYLAAITYFDMKKLIFIAGTLSIAFIMFSNNRLFSSGDYYSGANAGIDVDAGYNSEYQDYDTPVVDTIGYWDDDSIAIDSIAFWDGDNFGDEIISIEPISFAEVEDSATLHRRSELAGQSFEYTSPEGSVFSIIISEGGRTVTIDEGNANGVEVFTIPAVVTGLGLEFSVSTIEDFAFSDNAPKDSPMAGVKKLILSEGILFAGQGSFDEAPDLEEVIIPSTLEYIGYEMLSDCPKLKSVYIPENSELKTIEDFAFQNCELLESFYIPASVKEIMESPWRNCKALEKLTVSDDNYNFDVYDGVLYGGEDFRNLIEYPAGKRDKEYTVFYGTRAIENSAFFCNYHIEKVSFPASLDSISHLAFNECKNLKDVVFTDTISFIGNGAFNDCPNLHTIQLYGNPQYSQNKKIESYNSFGANTKILISETVPAPELLNVKGGMLERAWQTISKMPYLQILDIEKNDMLGFPEYFGKGRAIVFGNAYPKEDVLRYLNLIPSKLIAYDNIDSRGKIRRIYFDKGNKKLLFFFGGIGGNDLIVALFNVEDNKQTTNFIKTLDK